MIKTVRATAEDARLLARTRQTVWQQTYRGIYPDAMLDEYDLAFYEARDRGRIADPAHHYYLFLDGDDCIGYFSFGPYNYGSYKDFGLCLNNLYILSEYKGRGLGRLAFDLLREHCAQHGIRKFFCGCNVNNLPAVTFYRHMGGIQGDDVPAGVPKHDQIIHFEFYM